MKTKINRFIILFAGIIIGFLIAAQSGLNLPQYSSITIKGLRQSMDELIIANNENKVLAAIIDEKEEKLRELYDTKQNNSKDGSMETVMLKELDYNKVFCGLEDLEGPGVVITLRDNETKRAAGFDLNEDVIHDQDILTIINDLNIAGAEAISINGERLVNNTAIKCGGPIIRINGHSTVIPFEIKAIGNPTLLNAAITAPGTYGDLLKTVYGIYVDVKIQDSIVVNKYTGKFQNQHLKQVEGD